MTITQNVIIVDSRRSDSLTRFPNRLRTNEGFLNAISHMATVTFDTATGVRTFMVGISNVFDSGGAFLPEYNGLFVYDVDNQLLVTYRHLQQASGYYGPTDAQIVAWGDLIAWSWTTFIAYTNRTKFCRFHLAANGSIHYNHLNK